ncbi:MAG: DEAD/DEAH box helicase [Patescibacteria group bacterium]
MPKEKGRNIFNFLEGKKEILEKLKKLKKIEISGLTDSSLAFQISGLVCDTLFAKKQPVFVLLKNKEEAKKICRQLKFWNQLANQKNFPLNCGATPQSLYHLIFSHLNVYIFSFESFFTPLPSPFQFKNSILNLEQKQNIDKEQIIQKLLDLGFEEEKKTFLPGNFSRRGGILDTFSPQNLFPYRFEFYGEQIEEIYFFDPKTNKKIKNPATAQIIPTKLAGGKNNLLDYFGLFNNQFFNNKTLTPLVIFEDFNGILDFKTHQKFQNTIRNFLQIKITSFPGPKTDFSFSYQSPVSYQRNFPYFKKDIADYQKKDWQIFILTSRKPELENLFLNKNNISFFNQFLDQKNVVSCSDSKKTESKDFQNTINIIKNTITISSFQNPINYFSNPVTGFQNTKTKLLFLTDFEIFGKQIKLKPPKKIDTAFISQLKAGDYIVHIDHGIGKFVGMAKRKIEEIEREFFILEYADKDKLYLPCDCADKIAKYIGKTHPPIYRLHGVLWNAVKQRVKKDTEKLARELLSLYAKREISSGFVFSRDTLAQKELEDSFEYEETEDQLRVLNEIKKDMEGNQKSSVEKLLSPFFYGNENLGNLSRNLIKKPMDRLICGDVGFGKTELALRTAFKATQDKKQVALLCPTTILAQQHFNTFKSRLRKFPTEIAVLSRFKTLRQQKETIEKLAQGQIDIIIGTHRLLSSDVKFYDLGLLILDEEQRFGVKQKEKIKKMRENIDVLTLSATPIPRTLHLSLSGLRDISTLTMPLPGRLPVETFILPYEDKIICQAIKQEIKRRGQVYFLHNRVQTIEIMVQKLKKLLPRVKFAIAHGQMKETKLAKIMSDFYHQKFDVLICSSIIENGLDLPNVNTLIVDNATRFGLADLYQLRGRIGRSTKKAYAYFFYPAPLNYYQEKKETKTYKKAKNKDLNYKSNLWYGAGHSQNLKERAKKRLQALLEAKELGSGFQIAQRDLEIRGAGNIVGKEQSGNMKAVGLSLFCRLLAQAVEEIKTGKKFKEEFDVTVDLPLAAYIPKDFISSEKERLLLYQKMANVYEIKELKKFEEKIISKNKMLSFSHGRYKMTTKLPQEFLNLFEISEIKILARKAKIISIDTQIITPFGSKNFRRLILKSKNRISPLAAIRLLQKNKNFQISDFEIKIKLEDLGAPQHQTKFWYEGKNWLENLKECLKILITNDY